MKFIFIIGCAIFSLCGTAFLFLGIQFYSKTKLLVNTGQKTNGVVIGFATTTGRNNTMRFAPTIKYKLESGVEKQFTSNLFSDENKYQMGEKVEIIYDRENTNKAIMNNYYLIWGKTYGVFIAGIFCFLFCFLFLKKILQT